MRRSRFILQLLLLVTATTGATSAAAQGFGLEPRFSTQLDNDLFAGVDRDEDYSWGLSSTVALSDTRSAQLGLIAMTPRKLASSAVQRNDRPYASLLYLSTSDLRLHRGEDRLSYISYTLGAFGLDAAETVQKSVHEFGLGDPTRGWHNQISNGGEPTGRIVRAEQWLLRGEGSARGHRAETKFTVAGSAGFLTEGSVALSTRWGRFDSPWYSYQPELADYAPAPIAPIASFGIDRSQELYGFVGVRLKARAYNAFVQGQFADSALRISSADVAKVQGEAWAGVATTWQDLRITYTLRVATREIRHGPAARTLVWGGVTIERMF